MKFTFAIYLLLSSCFFLDGQQKVSVHIENIRNNKGVIQLAIFENPQQFKNEEPGIKINLDKKSMKDHSLNTDIELNPGTYAISVLDDEDRSGDLTYALLIYPNEGIGFSNYRIDKMLKPSFSDFDFTIVDKDISVQVILTYF